MNLRRSTLIAPCDNPELIGKLSRGPQDVAVLELEDGVHPDRKQFAREKCAELLESLDWGGRERVVRINSVPSGHVEADVDWAVRGRPDGVMLTKTAGASEVRHVARLLSEAEQRHGVPAGSIQVWCMIESARGVLNADDICAADPRLTAVVFGAGDFAADIGVKRISLGSFRRTPLPAVEYLYARGRVVAAARANGIDPLDVGSSDVSDIELNREMAEYAAQMGFSGSACFSPKQVEVVNAVFTPAEEDVAWARTVLQEAATAKADHRSVVVVNREMIDGPFLQNAQLILDRHDLAQKRASERSAP